MANSNVDYCWAGAVADASEANVSANKTDWDKANEFIISFAISFADPCNKPHNACQIKIQVDKDGGGFVDIGSSDMAVGTGTTLVDGANVTQLQAGDPTGGVCTSGFSTAGLEEEGDGQTASFAIPDDSYSEVHFAVDPSGGSASSTYTFRAYQVTTGAPLSYVASMPYVTLAAAAGQTATPSDNLSTEWDEVWEFAFGTFPTDDLSTAWTELYEFASESILSDNLSGDWDEVWILGSDVFISDTLTFKADAFYGGTDYAILAQDGDWLATQKGETIERQWKPAGQTATPSDNLSTAWDEVWSFAFGTFLEDDLSTEWDEVWTFAFGVFLEDDLSGDWDEVWTFASESIISDSLSGDWDEVWSFASYSILSDDLSTEWDEAWWFALDSILADSLSGDWSTDFSFIQTASISDNLSGDWDEVWTFASESIISDSLSGDWDEVWSFASYSILSDDLSGDWDEAWWFALESILEDDLSGDWSADFSFASYSILSDDLSGDWGETWWFALESILEDDLFGDWDTVVWTASESILSDNLSGDWDTVVWAASESILSDDLSGDWSTDFSFIQTANISDNLSGDWDEVWTFAFGVFLEDDLSADWDETWWFALESILSDDLSGDWTELYGFASEVVISDDLSGDWDEVWTFAFGTFLEDDLSGDWADQVDLGSEGTALIFESVTFSEVMDAGEIDPSAILAQDGDVLLAQDGRPILEQEVGSIEEDILAFADEVIYILHAVYDIPESISFSELLSVVAVTDDAIISESVTFSDQLESNILSHPLETQVPELLIGADGTFIEVQHRAADVSHSLDTLSLVEQIDFTTGYAALLSDTIIFSSIISSVPIDLADINESITLSDQIVTALGFPLTVNESITVTDNIWYGVQALIDEYLYLLDGCSIADVYQWINEQFHLSEILDPTLSEYTGAVFWFNDWYSFYAELNSTIDEFLFLLDEMVGVGHYDIEISSLFPATKEDNVTPWTEEDGSTLTLEKGYTDLYFDEKIQWNRYPLAIDDTLRFVEANYTQEYAMPCPTATGPCTTEATGDCAAPTTLGTLSPVLAGVTANGDLFYLTITWTSIATTNRFVRVFYRKANTQEKYSTILADAVDGIVVTPHYIECSADYEVLVRQESLTTFGAWQHFTVTVPPVSDTISLTATAAVLAHKVRSRTDTLAFSDQVTATIN